MPKTLLLEAGFLGLPVGLFGSRIPDFKEIAGQILAQEKLDFSRIKIWVNSHRLAILVEGLAEAQSDSLKEIRGPRASAAYDLNNIPTPAATGFAAAQGMEMKDLIVREIDGEKFLFARKMTQGQSLEKCINRVCCNLLNAFPFTYQSWCEKCVFPQPLLSLCAMLDDSLVEFEIDGTKAKPYILKFNGLSKEQIPVDNAANYPAIMNRLGLMNEFSEKKKNFEARIRSVLPQNFLIRDMTGSSAQNCLLFENAHPLLVKFENRYLEMPEVIVTKVLSDYFGYLVCEDAHGKLLPATVVIPHSLSNGPDEAEIRSGILNQQLEKIWQIWNRDVHSLPGRLEKIAEQISEQGQIKTELFSDCSLIGIIEGLCEYLGRAEEQKKASAVGTLIEEGEQTEIGKLLQGTGFSVIFNRLSGVEAFKNYVDCLKEVCRFFEGRIPVPQDPAAEVVCLAILLQGHVNHVRCFDCSIERVLTYIFCSDLRFDLFSTFAEIFNGVKLDRRAWIDAAVRLLSREVLLPITLDQLCFATEFDPAALNRAFREWKNVSADQFEDCSALYARVRSKIAGIERKISAEPESEIEIDISQRLDQIENLAGVDYLEIFNFFVAEKVNLEACLMNLPAVLDDTNDEQAARICLLQRLNRQLGRLPFIRKEKKAEKS